MLCCLRVFAVQKAMVTEEPPLLDSFSDFADVSTTILVIASPRTLWKKTSKCQRAHGNDDSRSVDVSLLDSIDPTQYESTSNGSMQNHKT